MLEEIPNTPKLTLASSLYSYDHGALREPLFHLHEEVTDLTGTIVVAAICLDADDLMAVFVDFPGIPELQHFLLIYSLRNL